jgi:hypothetical protein
MKPMISALYALGFLGTLAAPGVAAAQTAAPTASASTGQHPHIKRDLIKHEAIKHAPLKPLAKSHTGGSTGSSGQPAAGGQAQGDGGDIKAPKPGVKYGGP